MLFCLFHFEQRSRFDRVLPGQDLDQRRIELGPPHFGEESEVPEVHPQNRRTAGGLARHGEECAVSAEHDDEVAPHSGDERPVPRRAGLAGGARLDQHLEPAAAEPIDQLASDARRVRARGLRDHSDPARPARFDHRGSSPAGRSRGSCRRQRLDGRRQAQQRERLAVALGAGDRRIVGPERARARAPASSRARCSIVDRRSAFVAHQASLADSAAADLELRLDQRQQQPPGGKVRQQRRHDLGQRDEGDVDDDEIERPIEGVGGEIARVHPLANFDPRVVAHLEIEQAVADVDGGDVRGAALQEAVGETSGRGADVEAAPAGRIDREMFERGGELAAGARHEGLGRAGELQPDVVPHRAAGLVHPHAVDLHLAGHHRAMRLLARGEEAALNQ